MADADQLSKVAILRKPEASEGAFVTSPTLAARESAVHDREQAADLREQAADRRDKIADQREEALWTRTEHRPHDETRLLEANENLIVAAANLQTMTEAAENAATQLAFKAERDFLTGLPNRALLTDRLAQSIALAQRHRKRVVLMFLDLDNFKDVNDSLGHAVGDQLLQSIAKRLEACVRSSDTVSRHGGDEFIVLLSEVEAAHDAAHAAEKLIKALAEPHFIGEHRLDVTLSIGISLYPDDGDDGDALLVSADTAMYHAKSSGRNNVKRFTPEMSLRGGGGEPNRHVAGASREDLGSLLRFAACHQVVKVVQHVRHAHGTSELADRLPNGNEVCLGMRSRLRDATRADNWRNLVSIDVPRSSPSSISLTNCQRLK